MELRSLPSQNARHSGRNSGTAPIAKEGGGEGGRKEEQQKMPDDDEIVVYRVYKERWFGLAGLMLMNIVTSWGWLAYASVSDSTQIWSGLRLDSQSPVNWLSTVIFFTYVIAAPAVLYTLNRHGVKPALMASLFLVLAGMDSLRLRVSKVLRRRNVWQLINPMLATSPERIPDMIFLGCNYYYGCLAAVVVY
ncbi:hypothetical protein B9Z19DRAFT_230590 [Tuber borchii]|uniref:Uncharacterized protein n=1 Tax=Tuber borchii TaxID=42251 RepID=A0A2T6ZMN3_TUBBO|nr:hypothetical protein B9Z19DRAFT_230590 [Tuber borchii]